MASFMRDFENLEIPLEEILSATNNFNKTNVIGIGDSGMVYKGELSHSEGLTIAVFKRLHRKYGQGQRDLEILIELRLLSTLRHENLISLLGFCIESDEILILVYEYASYGSLDMHLSSPDLSWNQRLLICIGAARGLSFLHDPNGTQQRVVHGDIKSSIILLDQNWNAKITTDFGLSKLDPYSFMISNAVGSPGYCDPLYLETGLLTKESDVYSFGAVLVEVLCGTLVTEYQGGKISDFKTALFRKCYEEDKQDTIIINIIKEKFSPDCQGGKISDFKTALFRKCYEEDKLDTIILNSIKEKISPDCLERFSRVAYRCLEKSRQNRPSMAEVVIELEIALQYQTEHTHGQFSHYEEESDTEESDFWETKLPQGWRAMIDMFNIPRAIYTIKSELFSFLDKGILFDEGNKLLWINNDGKKSVLISAKRFLELDEGYDHHWVFQNSYSRFRIVADYHYGKWHEIRCKIKTSILSLGTMYAASLIFKHSEKPNMELKNLKLMSIKWKTEDLSVYSTHNAELTQDNWYKIRMWNFFNHGQNANFDIVLEKLTYYDDLVESDLLIQGIEFKPIKMAMQHEEVGQIASISISDKEEVDDDLYWEKKLPNNSPHYIQVSYEPLYYTSKKELYLLLCRGFLAYHGKLWISLRKSTSGICTILPATHILSKDTAYEHLETLCLSESRFKEVKKLGNDDWYVFTCRLRAYMFSPHYNYACYLVFKFEDNHIQSHDTRFFKSEYKLGDTIHGTVFAHFNLIPLANIPIIEPKDELESHDSSNLQRFGKTDGQIADVVNSWMEDRNDGWMEVRLSKPLHQLENHASLEVKLWKSKGGSFSGIIVEGIEFRPMHDI